VVLTPSLLSSHRCALASVSGLMPNKHNLGPVTALSLFGFPACKCYYTTDLLFIPLPINCQQGAKRRPLSAKTTNCQQLTPT
jgi:hypothetical protein